jgi:hypothetical protein
MQTSAAGEVFISIFITSGYSLFTFLKQPNEQEFIHAFMGPLFFFSGLRPDRFKRKITG